MTRCRLRLSLIAVLCLALVFGSLAAASAKESGTVTVVETDNIENIVVPGKTFPLKIQVNYFDVPRDRVIIVRISSSDEPRNVNDEKVQNACKDMSKATCDGFWMVEFKPRFAGNRYGKHTIRVQLITQTMDGKAIHFMDDRDFTVDVRRRPTIKIDKVDAPRPPDTVRVNESVPIQVKFSTSWLLQDSKVKITIEATSGGKGRWTWESGKLTGGVIVTSEPITIKLDKPGRWTFRVEAAAPFAETAHVTFGMEAVQQEKRKIGPVTLSYPKPPETIRVDEEARFDVRVGYENLAAGTQILVVFGDHATGEDLSQGWQQSRPVSGSGTYIFEKLMITPPAKGDWKVDVRIKLPLLNDAGQFKTMWEDTVTLRVVPKSGGAAPGNTNAYEVNITKLDVPPGTFKLNETIPIVVTIHYDKLGDAGAALRVEIIKRDTGRVQGAANSVWLKKNGSFTFPPAYVPATTPGTHELEVRVKDRDKEATLATRRFSITVVS